MSDASEMPGMVVVTHGAFAEELVAAVREIVGEIPALCAVSIDWNDDVEEAARRIQRAIGDLGRDRGVLVLTDMFGGTPTNVALSNLEPGKVEIVTGVNLPMVIKFANLREKLPLAEAAALIARQGREAIHVASELLGPRGSEAEGR